MADNTTLIWLSFGIVVSIGCFNTFGITVTKFGSAPQRSTIDTARTVSIWLCSCLLGLETFQWRTIFGFVMLVAGTLIYNEIVVIPIWDFDKYTKDSLKTRSLQKSDVEEARDEYLLNTKK